MNTENKTTFLNPEKPRFYLSDIQRISIDILDYNDVYLPDITDADLAIPLSQDGNIVGFGFLFFKNDECIFMRMIDPSHQKQGLSYKLLDEIERVARKNVQIKKLVSIVQHTPSSEKAYITAGFNKGWEQDEKVQYYKIL